MRARRAWITLYAASRWRSGNGLAFTSRSYTPLVKSYGLQQGFITPYSPEQNGKAERVIQLPDDQCVHRY
jgi:putative transposase